MKRSIVTIGTILLVLGSAFAGGSGEQQSGVATLRFATTWGAADSKGTYFIPMLEAYRAENADSVNLVVEEYGSDDMVTKITVELASGELPDIFSYWGGIQRLGPLVEGDALLDMNEYFAVTSVVSREDFTQAGINHFTIDGTLRGIPMEANVAAFVCNREMFEQFGLDFPATYEDMLEVGRVFRENGIIPFAMASNGGNPSHFWFSEMYKQFPGGLEEIRDLPNSRRFATENALRVAQIIDEMRRNEMLPADTVSNGAWGPAFALYNEGRAAMIYTYPWMLGSMDQQMQDKSVVIDVPELPGATESPASFISGFATFGFVVNRASFEDPAKREALISFMDFMISDEMFNELMQGGLIPTKAYDMPVDAFNDVMQQTLRHYQDRPQTTSHFWQMHDPAVANAFKAALDELYAGIITPEDFVDQVQTAFDESDM